MKKSAELRAYEAPGVADEFFDLFDAPGGKAPDSNSYAVSMVGIDEYNRTVGLSREEPVSLGLPEYGVNYNVREEKDKLEAFAASGSRITRYVQGRIP